MKKLIGVLVLLGFSTLLISCNNTTKTVSETPANPAVTTSDTNVTPSVSVSDQAVQNESVTITEVDAPQKGWIVIHQSSSDGSVKVPENIGYAPVQAGKNNNVTVKLNQPVASGEKLWVMLHQDEGQVGAYEFPGADKPVKVSEDIVVESFTTTDK